MPDRRGWEQKVHSILASNMIDVIEKNMYGYVRAADATVYVIAYFVVACVHVWDRKSQSKHPN